MTIVGFATLWVLALYLALFFLASNWAARAAGRPVWLFGRATGRNRLATLGFRAAFALAFVGPLLQAVIPALREADPLWSEPGAPLWSLPGHVLAVLGAMLGWAGQVGMGASRCVGVAEDAMGELVTEGLFRVSRNPVFTGQLLLLAGVALSIPAVLAWMAVLLLWLSARGQIISEERHLETRFGEAYRTYHAQVPRWIGPVLNRI
ncbi:methyltransferase family protein [Paracoccus niistensis]|uniref:Methyltransferase family protein n=1 Tax=Paracoccus niistensis TaxID=632935 RepID=A0ABV6I8C7_9RHOB